MASCALWESEEALGWVILINALAPLVHYSESPTLVPLQILHDAQLAIIYCLNSVIRPRYNRLTYCSESVGWPLRNHI